jgi:hypothetical protein
MVDKWPDIEKRACQLSAGEFERQIVDRLPVVDRPAAWDQYRAYYAVRSFFAFMDYQAQLGMEIKSTHGSSNERGMNLGYVGTYIYWGVEILIVALLAASIVKKRTAEPFCRQCQEWKKPQVLGAMNLSAAGNGVAAIMAGDLATARQCAAPAGSTTTHATAFVCPTCDAAGEVDVKVATVTKVKNKTRVTVHAFATYPPNSLPHLADAFTPAEATAQQPPPPS